MVQEVPTEEGPAHLSGGGTGGRGRSFEEGGQGPENSPCGHHDTISAVSMSNTFILTGSTDGLIQVWK